MLKAYSEYLDDVENAINVMHKSEKYRAMEHIKNFKFFKNLPKENRVFLLNQIGYKSNSELDALSSFITIKDYFKIAETQVRNGDTNINDRLKILNSKAENISNMQPSVETEEINYFPY